MMTCTLALNMVKYFQMCSITGHRGKFRRLLTTTSSTEGRQLQAQQSHPDEQNVDVDTQISEKTHQHGGHDISRQELNVNLGQYTTSHHKLFKNCEFSYQYLIDNGVVKKSVRRLVLPVQDYCVAYC